MTLRKRSVGFVIAAVAGLALTTAVPAQAHSTSYDWYTGCGWGGFQDCGHASVSSSHRTITVCDDTADGNVPFVQYTRNGIGYELRDPNGAKSGCGSEYRVAGVQRWRMCVDYGSYNVCIRDWITA